MTKLTQEQRERIAEEIAAGRKFPMVYREDLTTLLSSHDELEAAMRERRHYVAFRGAACPNCGYQEPSE